MSISLFKEVQNIRKRIESLASGQLLKLKILNDRVRIEVKPDDGLWQKKHLHFEIKTKEYPRSPCKVLCKSQILHPNILEIDGEVCLSLFDEDWFPDMRLDDYINGILFILHNPNFDDPLSDFFHTAKSNGKIPEAIKSIV
jgi:ubiquitin-conjugating enzyme E2 M